MNQNSAFCLSLLREARRSLCWLLPSALFLFIGCVKNDKFICQSDHCTFANKRLWIHGATAIERSECREYKVAIQDPLLNPTSVSFDIELQLNRIGGGEFFSDPSCSSPAGTVTIAANTEFATFYFKNDLNEDSLLRVREENDRLGIAQLQVFVEKPPVGPQNQSYAAIGTLKSPWQ